MSLPAPTDRVKWIDRPEVRGFLGRVLIGGYVRLVRATSRVVYDPPDFWERMHADWPVILTSWHGQSNLAYAVMPGPEQFAILMSLHPDGQMMAEMARSFGYTVVEGSGASERQRHGTGGVAAYRAMLRILQGKQTLFATADIPPDPGRKVSQGMISLARRSGRPFFVLATSSSRRKVLERVWDKMQLHYPFSTISMVCRGPFYMTDPSISDDAYADQLRAALDEAMARSFALADGKATPEAPQ